MSELSLNINEHGGVRVISFRDNAILDTLTVQRVSRQLYEIVEQPRSAPVLIDFENVRFLSSQALGVLLTLRRKADQAGTQVAFAALRPELSRVFQLTKLDSMFQFFDSTAAALAHFAEPGKRG